MTAKFIYTIIAAGIFIFAFCVCFHAWADKEVLVHRVCAHKYIGSAILIDKGAYGYGCHWKLFDRPNIDERWDTCREFKEGEINNEYVEISYACQ